MVFSNDSKTKIFYYIFCYSSIHTIITFPNVNFFTHFSCRMRERAVLSLRIMWFLNGLNQDLINNIIKSIDDLNDTNFVFNKFTKKICDLCLVCCNYLSSVITISMFLYLDL